MSLCLYAIGNDGDFRPRQPLFDEGLASALGDGDNGVCPSQYEIIAAYLKCTDQTHLAECIFNMDMSDKRKTCQVGPQTRKNHPRYRIVTMHEVCAPFAN